MEAQEIKAKYTSKKTAEKYGVDFQGFTDAMADYGLKVNVKADYVEVIEADPECFAFGEVVDTANYILIWDAAAGDWFGALYPSEMVETYIFSNGAWIASDEVEVPGYPLYVKRALKN